MKLRLFSILLSFALCYTSSHAQKSAIDSLRIVLTKPDIADTSRMLTMTRLGYSLYNINPDSTIMLGQQALEQSRKINFRLGESEGLFCMGLGNTIKGNLDTAVYFNEQSVAIKEAIGDKDGLIKVLNNLAILHSYKSEYFDALRSFEEILNIHEENNNEEGIALIKNNIGLVYSELANFPKALEYYLESLPVIEKKPNNNQALANTLQNIGIIYSNMDEYEEALSYFTRAAALLEAIGNKYQLGHVYGNLSVTYFKKSAYDSAEKYLNKAYELQTSFGDKNGLAFTLDYYGYLYEERDELDRSADYYRQSLELKTETGNRSGIVKSATNLAKVLTLQKRYAEALKYANLAEENAEITGVKSDLSSVLGTLHFWHKEQGQYEKALEYYEEYASLEDSIFNESNTREISRLEAQYEYEKQRERLELRNELIQKVHAEEIKRRNVQQYATSAGLILFVLVALATGSSYWIKKRANQRLMELNEEIRSQNEEILAQNEEITNQHNRIEQFNKNLTDNINTAKRIQKAIFPFPQRIEKTFSDYFIFFRPKDIVSGDFYWFNDFGDEIIIAVADCTGHGVSGAFMSLIGYDRVNDVIFNTKERSANGILSVLDEQINYALNQQQTSDSDGMDIAVVVIDKTKRELVFAGAKLPLLLYQPSGTQLIRGDRHAVGGYNTRSEHKTFTPHSFSYDDDTRLFLFSDGFPTQLGGPDGKKYRSQSLVNVLTETNDQPLNAFPGVLERELNQWIDRGSFEQLDDVTVLGFALKGL
jgi:tetratricopeptide (TPR) repeat protein